MGEGQGAPNPISEQQTYRLQKNQEGLPSQKPEQEDVFRRKGRPGQSCLEVRRDSNQGAWI